MRKLTDEEKALALNLAAEGKTIIDIRKALKMDHKCFWLYKQSDPTFTMAFERARQEGLEEIADSLLNLVDEYEDVQKARVKSENIRWILSKRKPATYGDKLDINVTQTVDIGAALLEAKGRAMLPGCYQENSIEVEHREIVHESNASAGDCKSPATQKSADAIASQSLEELL